jgi:hypothetical protein
MVESQAQGGLRSNLFASPVRTTGVGLTKTNAQATYKLCFGHSRYHWKTKEISFAIQLVSHKNTLEADGNHHKK